MGRGREREEGQCSRDYRRLLLISHKPLQSAHFCIYLRKLLLNLSSVHYLQHSVCACVWNVKGHDNYFTLIIIILQIESYSSLQGLIASCTNLRVHLQLILKHL